MLGTIVNTGTIIAGSLLGILIHSRLPQKMVNIVFQGIGLFTLGIGVSMFLATQSMILAVVSIVIGSILGQWINIDYYLRRFSDELQAKCRRVGFFDRLTAAGDAGRFTEGFITASMLFCVGSMSILGAIEDGMGETPKLLFTKSIMDGISSVALASSYGICIMFTSIPVLLYQGSLTLFAGFMMRFMSDAMMADLTGVGGLLMIGLGINILKIKEINVTNMLPSLVVIVLLSYCFQG